MKEVNIKLEAMTDGKDLTIDMSEQVKAQMLADPELAKAMKEFMAIMHQAHEGVKSGQYKTMDDAMEALTGSRPQKVDLETGEELDDGSTMNKDMGFEEE